MLNKMTAVFSKKKWQSFMNIRTIFLALLLFGKRHNLKMEAVLKTVKEPFELEVGELQ